MVDSREVEVDLMLKVVDLKFFCRIKENLNGRMLIKTRLSGMLVIHTEEVLYLTEEEVILVLEVDFMVIVSNVVKRDIDLLNVDLLKVDKVTEML